MLGEDIEHLLEQSIRLRRTQGHADLAVDAKNLMWMPLLRAADEAFLYGRRAFVVDRQTAAVDAGPFDLMPQLAPVDVVADDSGQRHVGLESAQHIRHIGRASQPRFTTLFAKQDNWRFLAHALGVAPGVTVENEIAQHEHARAAELFQQVNQVIRHWPKVQGPRS